MSEASQAIRTIDVPDLQALGANLKEKLADISERLAARIIEYESRALEHAEMIDAITVSDASSYEVLSTRVRQGTLFLDEAEEFFEPWRELFYTPYNGLLTRKKSVVESPTLAIKNAKARLIQYGREQKEKAENNARIAKQKQDQAEIDRKLALGVKAEAAGLSEQAVQAILEAPSTAPSPQPAQFYNMPPVKGQSGRDNWKAEVFDKKAFVKAAAKDDKLLAYITLDQAALNREAPTHKADLVNFFPGVRGVNSGTLAIRR